MALTDLARLRLAIADRARVALREQVGLGDGAREHFQTQLAPVVTGSETVLVNETPVATYLLDYATGLLTFTVPPAVNAGLLITYNWTTFSDAELQDLLDRYGLRRAGVRALEWLLADTERFLRYTFGQTSVDRSAARENLLALLERLTAEMGSGAVRLVQADDAARRGLLAPFMGENRYDAWATE
jgi:hypothetical protein